MNIAYVASIVIGAILYLFVGLGYFYLCLEQLGLGNGWLLFFSSLFWPIIIPSMILVWSDFFLEKINRKHYTLSYGKEGSLTHKERDRILDAILCKEETLPCLMGIDPLLDKVMGQLFKEK